MTRKTVLIAIIASLALVTGYAWAGPQMNPGKWEITTKTEMAGMPPQTVTHTQCITDNDLVPMSQDANQECQVTDVRTVGNTVLWKITCGGQGGGGRMEGTGQVTYQGDTMQGFMEMTIADYNMQVKNTLYGRRVGDCDGSASGTGTPTYGSSSTGSGSGAGNVIADEATDLGQAARDEAKRSTMEEVRKGVRGAIKGLFN